MSVDDLRKYCLSFPDATENLQWGDDLCFKIRGKIFATLALTAVPQKMCFKCTPESFAELVEREGIHPAPYVGRYKWVILDHLNALRSDELKDLIRQSYAVVASKAPKSGARNSKQNKKQGKKRSQGSKTRPKKR
ncbi:MAG TPA: MmcQ/YjbR family DNA-binding protein [Candidatus Binatus sp.]|jgi:predicted DNA-binding protein (MmcQ/YjbR family)|nr:MmcQ/YjbR family DNA-binding protein [Candidatus Binatus sp.]